MELLSKNYERWANDVNMEMPQLLNRQNATGSTMAHFSEIHKNVIASQYQPQGGLVNFSEEELKEEIEKEAIADAVSAEVLEPEVVPQTPEVEENFIKNLAQGKYVSDLERAVASRPMNIFGNGQSLKGAVTPTGVNPEENIVVENIQSSEKTEISGPRSVEELNPGMAVAGLDHEPVVAPEEALPEAKTQATEAAIPVYPEGQITNTDTVVEDPVSVQNVAASDQMFDQAEAKRNEEIELYKSFMNSVM